MQKHIWWFVCVKCCLETFKNVYASSYPHIKVTVTFSLFCSHLYQGSSVYNFVSCDMPRPMIRLISWCILDLGVWCQKNMLLFKFCLTYCQILHYKRVLKYFSYLNISKCRMKQEILFKWEMKHMGLFFLARGGPKYTFRETVKIECRIYNMNDRNISNGFLFWMSLLWYPLIKKWFQYHNDTYCNIK